MSVLAPEIADAVTEVETAAYLDTLRRTLRVLLDRSTVETIGAVLVEEIRQRGRVLRDEYADPHNAARYFHCAGDAEHWTAYCTRTWKV